MSKPLHLCNQSTCDRPADFLYTWPGNDLAGACREHAGQIAGLSRAMGFHIQLIPYVYMFPEVEDGQAQSEQSVGESAE